jgi:hypothetical protein
MDFLDPKKTRRNGIQLMVGYVLVAIALTLSTLILIYYAYGFGVTREGDLQQKGLVFVSSEPSGANLYVNGKPKKLVDKTNTKLNLPAGNYTLDITRTGYNSWHRPIEVVGGSVNHFVYPFLFPTELTTKAVKTYSTVPALTTQSPDRRWLLALTDPTTATFDVVDLSKKPTDIAQTTQFSVSASLLTPSSAPAKWELLEWSSNNRHMLYKRTFVSQGAEKFEYILVDRQRPEGSHNLSKELGVTPTQVILRDKQPDDYYLYDATTQVLSEATLNNPAPTPILKGVLAFKAHSKDTLVYITKTGAPAGKVSVHFRQSDREYVLRNLTESDQYLLDAARFSGDWYIAVGSHAQNNVFIYRNPQSISSGTDLTGAVFALRVSNPTSVSFSANAQFIAAQNGKDVHVYDADNDKSYHYTFDPSLDAPQMKATWMDGDRLTWVSGGKQMVADYDNINKRTLVNASVDFVSGFDQQYRYLYTFTKPANGQAGLTLSATALRTAADL